VRNWGTEDPESKNCASLSELPPELGILIMDRLDSYEEYLALKDTCARTRSVASMALRSTIDRQAIRGKANMFRIWGSAHVHLDWDEDLITHNDWCQLKKAVQEAHRLFGGLGARTLEVDVIHTLQ
jgi:hypothetical protein